VAAGGEPATGGAASGGVASSGAASNAAGSGNAAGEGGEAPSEPERGPLTAFLAGDSTVSTYADTASPGDQAGWGQMLPAFFDDLVTVDNRAIGGRTSRRFIEEGHLDAIWEDIASGDYLFVQFGTNDGNKSATYELDGQTIPYYLDPSTDFKTYLRKYVDGARERGATPVLVTPPPRNSAYCIGGNGTGGHAQAMRELGAAEDVTVLDLNTQSVEYLKAICPAPTPENFFFLRPNGTVDGTHFQEAGARKLAGIVALELAASELPLAGYLQ
jgi:lysophospholipase L1-like esterase